MPANRAAGICWMPVLYSWTALLKKRRLAAILFSRSDSSPASCWKLALALRSGDRKSTRLNSSHVAYLVCRLLLEKKRGLRSRDGEARRERVARGGGRTATPG